VILLRELARVREEAERQVQAKDMELEYVMQLAQKHQETIVQEVTALMHTCMNKSIRTIGQASGPSAKG
jgi:hypothetical protein